MAVAVRTQPFEHLVLDFLAYLEFERGLSCNTLEAYRSDLLQYGAYLREHGSPAGAEDRFASWQERQALVRLDEYQELEQRYAAPAGDNTTGRP